MKTEEQIKEELLKHQTRLKENKFELTDKEKYLHECIIEALQWVLK